MSDETIIRYLRDRPFVPFALVTADGRRLDVRRPEQAMSGVRGRSVLYVHDDRRVEVVDSRLIVSLVTLAPADPGPAADDTFGEPTCPSNPTARSTTTSPTRSAAPRWSA